MRSWLGVPVETLCRKHLLGEHLETHMMVGHIKAGRRLGKYAELFETDEIKPRHNLLAAEMERRGYQHQSPLRYVDRLKQGRVDRTASRKELHSRCADCRVLFRAYFKR